MHMAAYSSGKEPRAVQHGVAVRPLRARDPSFFVAFLCSALAAAERQAVSPHPIAAIADNNHVESRPVCLYNADWSVVPLRENLMAANHKQLDPMQGVAQLREAVNAFGRFIAELPDNAVVEKACGPKEVLAHLVFWMESYVVQTDALLSNPPPAPPHGSFDDLNAQAVDASRGVSAAALLHRHHAASDQLCRVAQIHDPERMVFVLKKGSVIQRPLTWYLTAEANHIRWHQQILEGQARGEYLNDIPQLRQTVDSFCQFVQELPHKVRGEQVQKVKE